MWKDSIYGKLRFCRIIITFRLCGHKSLFLTRYLHSGCKQLTTDIIVNMWCRISKEVFAANNFSKGQNYS